MRSPFPGFDPYLEARGYWREFHNHFLSQSQYVLGGYLPDAYEIRIEERLSLVYEEDDVHHRSLQPDVAIVRSAGALSAGPARSSTATLEPILLALPSRHVEEVTETRLAIRRFPNRDLITVIELLSPSNKQAPGGQLYEQKRQELLEQQVHLVEFDMLVGGNRLPMDDELPPAHYYAFVSRTERRRFSETYAWTIRDPLPTIPIPLRAPDTDIPLDLASIFATVYERARLGRSIDYAAPLELPLSPEDRQWSEAIGHSAASPTSRP